MIEIRPTTVQDTALLAPILRQSDVDEIKAAGRSTPLGVLRLALDVSDQCLTVLWEDKPIGMFGARTGRSEGNGIVWMMGADELSNHPREFLREGRAWVNQFLERYTLLMNVVDARNEAAIRWLKKLGFEFIYLHEKYGAESRPHWQFEMRRTV